jgi:hypothetical protein
MGHKLILILIWSCFIFINIGLRIYFSRVLGLERFGLRIVSWMGTVGTIRLPKPQRIKKRPHSHVHLAHLPTGGCHLDYAMLPLHFKDA